VSECIRLWVVCGGKRAIVPKICVKRKNGRINNDL